MTGRSAAGNAADDTLVAHAIDPVLQAERDAREAVAVCEQVCAQALEWAREHARSICARAEVRSGALHGHAAKVLEA